VSNGQAGDATAAAALASTHLPGLIEQHVKRIPDATAILGPGRLPLTYSRLFRHVEEVGRRLRTMGIGRRDRVAVILPNGPEMATAIVAVASNAACAPMNPAYRAEELDRYFADLAPRALLIQAGADSPARQVALARGIVVMELTPIFDAEAGLFTLAGAPGDEAAYEPVTGADVATLLFTSGTTARPKIVPQTHANICASVGASIATLALSEADRCLNVLPLFHGHGLIATVLTSLAAGSSVVCTPGCEVHNFFGWLTTFQPTWYSAVPTMHQAILAQARRMREPVATGRLRLARSASAPLPPSVFTELEQTFGVPLIEFYGMTESTSSPIACNPLPPSQRKIGSVGVPVKLDVAILDETGAAMAAGRTGQIAIRGSSVMLGYLGNPAISRAAFAGEWFKTRDLGFFDDDGYLFLAGRTEEMINRGGEKIAPREVEEVLLEHPAIAEAVTFPVPHASLGEDIAAAVVLRPASLVTQTEIRQFAIGRVAGFKVPAQVLIVEKIPRGPTGKVQRSGLAGKFGLTSLSGATQAFVAPRTQLENVLAEIWATVLDLERVGAHDNFFALGGDSLLATHVLARVHELMHLELEVSCLFESPTVAELAQHIETLSHAHPAPDLAAGIQRVARDAHPPASVAQERLWTLQRHLPDLPYFNVLYTLRLMSSLDAAVLERCINAIVQRHEILRTTLAMIDGRCVQVIAPRLTVSLVVEHLNALSASKRAAAARQIIEDEVLCSFDLERGPLLRARLLRLGDGEDLLLLAFHQVVCDGRSLGIFVEELATLYDAFAAGRPSPLAPLPIQYADFAIWQRGWQSDPDVARQLAYWREQLRDPLPPIRFAPARKRRAIDHLHMERREWTLSQSLSGALKEFSRQEGVTPFMVLASALTTLLHCYLGKDDVRVATNVANRTRPGTEGLIGPLVNTVVLRTNLGGDPSASEVIGRVRATTIAAFAHQGLPFEYLAEVLARERAPEPIIPAQIMILLQNASLRPVESSAGGFAFQEANPGMLQPLVTTPGYDVILMLHESALGLVGTCAYKSHLFGAASIDRLLRDFREVLSYMVTRPERPISSIRRSLMRRGRTTTLSTWPFSSPPT
jgi:acyl-CoA synthetase (AMP-forming)/AMP-acid ligase II